VAPCLAGLSDLTDSPAAAFRVPGRQKGRSEVERGGDTAIVTPVTILGHRPWGGPVGFLQGGGRLRIRHHGDALVASAATLSDGVPERTPFASSAVELSFMLEDGDRNWSVGLAPEDEDHIIFGGTSTFLGPDGTLWTFPSSPNLFDRDIVETALAVLYLEGAAGLVDARSLAERVSFITRQRNEAVDGLAHATRRGELREPPHGS
jgi:hypothetical protein